MSQDNDDSSAFSMDTVSPDCPLKIEDTASDGKLKKLREEDDPEYGIKMEDENEPHQPSSGVAKKKRSSKAMILEDTSKPANTKKPRVTRERALKVAEKMKKELVESYNMGLTEMDLKTLALAAGGYTNPRSDAILAAKAILIEEEGVVEKCKIDKEQGLKLNSKGVENLVPEEPPIASNEAALEKHWTLFEKKLSSGTKRIVLKRLVRRRRCGTFSWTARPIPRSSSLKFLTIKWLGALASQKQSTSSRISGSSTRKEITSALLTKFFHLVDPTVTTRTFILITNLSIVADRCY